MSGGWPGRSVSGMSSSTVLLPSSGRIWTAPWSRTTWLQSSYLVTGGLLALVAGGMLAGLVVVGVLLSWTVVVPLLAAGVLPGLSARFGRWQRDRIAAFLGERIGSDRPVRGDRAHWRWVRDESLDPAAWRQFGYHLAQLVLGAIGFLAVVSTWSVALVFSTFTLHYQLLPPVNSLLWDNHSLAMRVLATVGGLLVFFGAPLVVRGMTELDLTVARLLLSDSAEATLTRRVRALTDSRSELVEAADAERRRIERDLHDGTQQRLVSLAVHLGMARANLQEAPEEVRTVLDHAHAEAKEALRELRDVVRGLHPAVLNDRGLNAALSGVAARCPVPVRLRVDIERRPSPTVEAIAFFVVSEALTNVVKHAGASRIEVTAVRTGDRLVVSVLDDGVGGANGFADATDGTGLRGLAQRARSVDGELRVESPAGGPTLIRVELPCES